MKLRATLSACFLLSLASTQAAAGIIVSDFEDTPFTQAPGSGVLSTTGFTLRSGACDFTTTGYSGLENGIDGADNGTTHLFASDVTITCGGVFDLLTWDMGPDFQESAFPWLTDLFYADGSSFLAAAGPMNPPYDFFTWSSIDPSFTTNLVSFRIYTSPFLTDPVYGQRYQLAIDNFTVSVPEPGTLALLALGMLGLGVVRRRRRL